MKKAGTVDSVIRKLEELRADLKANPGTWQNQSLEDYLESTQAWLEDSKDTLPEEPSWDFVVGLFGVGKIYE